MPLSATSRLQAASGTLGSIGSGVTPFTVTLPNPTSEASVLVVWIATAAIVTAPAEDPPWGVAASGPATLYCFWRGPVPAGESSWDFTPNLASICCWRVSEWATIDAATPVDAFSPGASTANVATVGSGTANPTSNDFVALAAYRCSRSSSTGVVFPAGRSYSAGFTEVDYQQNGTGGTNGHLFLAIAENYPGAAGAYADTLTLDTTGGGSFASLSEFGLLICLRGADEQLVDPGQVVSSPGAP